jgi:hypothetical protein
MAYYRLQRLDDAEGESYWVEARSEEQARRLVALYAQDADATRLDAFGCRLSSIQRRASPLFVVRRSNAPLSIARRSSAPPRPR